MVVAYHRPTKAIIDTTAITENIKNEIAHLPSETFLFAVVKANGYGHGAVQTAQAAKEGGAVGFCVATIDEAIELREAGINEPLLILGVVNVHDIPLLAEYDFSFPVASMDWLVEADTYLKENPIKTSLKVHVKVDTGMGRIGITPDDEGLDFVKFVMEHPGLEVEGIFTHFAKSDEADKTSANHQLELFQNFIDRIQSELGLEIPVKHCSNSAAILEMPQANMDMVRAGITTYGLYPSEEVSKDIVPLRAAMSLYSHIIYCKTIHAGQSVSYGGLFTATKDTRVATIPVGYGDGYPRSLSGKGYVLIHGKKAPILGRVCMDQFMVDISGIPGAMEGDKVTLLGADGQERITAEELGELSGRFNYEFVCTLGKRIPRVYRRNGEITEVKDYFENF